MFYRVHAIAVLNDVAILGYVPAQPTANCWLITMCANTGMWAALAADIPNMTRSLKAPVGERNWFKRNRNNWIPQFATLPIIETFIAVIGAISYLTTGNWNPVEVIQSQAQGATLILLLVMVILAQWSTNTAANLVPPAMCFTNAGAKWNLSYKVAVLIAGLIGVCVMPWRILDQLYTYLGYFGSFLSALAGIMLCDYYCIRRRRLNVQDLYKPDGQYRYHGGFNLCGIIAWCAGTLAANIGSDYGYLFGLPTGFLAYFVLMKVWYLKKFPQAEVTSGYSEAYLGLSVGNDWVIPGYEAFAGVEEVPGVTKVDRKRYTGGQVYEAATGHKLIITFGRQYGSRGKELAKILAAKLDLPVYDEDMIRMASERLGMDPETARQHDEMPPSEWMHALTAGGMYAAKEYEAATSDKMFAIQSQIILELARTTSCILVGRCANYVLDRAGIPTIDIFVVANLEDRIQHIAERDQVDYDKAKSYVLRTEKKRQAYFNHYTTYEWGNPQTYDLCVNTSGAMSLDDLAEHIAGFIRNEPQQTAAGQTA